MEDKTVSLHTTRCRKSLDYRVCVVKAVRLRTDRTTYLVLPKSRILSIKEYVA